MQLDNAHKEGMLAEKRIDVQNVLKNRYLQEKL